VHLVLVNGKYIKSEDRDTTSLAEGDVLAIWPPDTGIPRYGAPTLS
jgi:molybdopterin converting factor small subunit